MILSIPILWVMHSQALRLPELVSIPENQYVLGEKHSILNPLRKIRVNAYMISKTEITNFQFEQFVKATGYVTDAEKFQNAMVFEAGLPEFRWINDPSAYWRFPNGKTRGGIEQKPNHPVTTISFQDALEFCKWADVRLPNLDEWEVACRAGSTGRWFFGEDRSQIIKYANIWHGRNHLKPDLTDGFQYTSPVGYFLPNKFGLYDMYGNVFEFCSGKLINDENPRRMHSRGGSWWCSKNSCSFFNSVDIGSVDIRASFSNQGFRIAKN